jgi:regulator of nucleoside diphosphate kinase
VKPKIVISSLDAERLEQLLETETFPGKDELEDELARAKIVDPREMPPDVVTMNSTVRFSMEGSAKTFQLTLVYPKDAKLDGSTLSVFAPVGCALLGLSAGDEIAWPKPGGGTLNLRIDEVVYQPERAGEYHR